MHVFLQRMESIKLMHEETIDQMAQLLEKNNIPVPDGVRKKDDTSSLDNKEKCHALVAGASNSSTFIIDLGESRHMVSTRELLHEENH